MKVRSCGESLVIQVQPWHFFGASLIRWAIARKLSVVILKVSSWFIIIIIIRKDQLHLEE
jgi:hypothetical protein